MTFETVLGTFLQRKAAGESVTFASLAEEHPELMPELANRFQELEAFQAARRGVATGVPRDNDAAVVPAVEQLQEHTPPSSRRRLWFLGILCFTTLAWIGSGVWQWRRAAMLQSEAMRLEGELVDLRRTVEESRRKVGKQEKFTSALIEEIAPLYGSQYAGAPYRDVRWDRDQPLVELDGHWFELLAINQLTIHQLVTYCQESFGDQWRQRFAIDLAVVLLGLRQPARSTVALKLRDPRNGRTLVVGDAEMSTANRASIQAGGTGALERVAPFADMRPVGDQFEITLDGRPVTLTGINHTPLDKMIQYARKTYGKWWLKMLAENLPDVLEDMGIDHGSWVSLQARLPNSTESIDRDGVLMTRVRWERLAAVRPLGKREALDTYRGLTAALQSRHAYFALGADRYLPAVAAAEASLEAAVDRTDFMLQLSQLVSLAGDAHTRLRRPRWEPLSEAFTPFLVGEYEGRLLAIQPDRSGFLDDHHPYLAAIDDVSLEKWLAAAQELGVQGSPQYVRKTTRRNLRFLPLLRRQLGIDATDTVSLQLQSADGKHEQRLTLPLSPRKPLYGSWPVARSRILDDGTGYLRVGAMDADARYLEEIVNHMFDFRSTRGLIIDVRGNPGGSRNVLRTLLPFFMPPSEPYRVVNVAKYRLRQGDVPDKPDGYLANRFLFPLASSVWNEEERTVIRQFATTFQPSWQPPDEGFSDWHFMVVSRPASEGVYWYDRPVIVLMNASCASATDIFLGAIQESDNVTLLGTSSSGMSGYTRTVELSPGFEASISTMCSFLPSGQLYHRGIAPDRHLEALPTDWIGETDALLDAAIGLVQELGQE